MKKTDILTAVGLVVGIIMMVWGMSTGGTNMIIFWDLASVIITVFGSVCALMITYPLSDFAKLGKIMAQSFKEPKTSPGELITQFSNLSKKARREGLLSLEDEISQIGDDFLKKGLQMVVDGIEPETIKEILELEISEMEARHTNGSNMLKTWGGYGPAFGMVGTLIGLIQMLANLSDSASLASGMAKALITTFYGSLMANLVLNPMASNLSMKSAKEASFREMMLEGILAIQSGVNPRIVEEKLITYLSPAERRKFNAAAALGGEVADNV
jgi:chemotaxis protein MotA